MMMSSTLVETVSINYEDFNESFLTCGTCLCMYDGQEHTPKLLACSHTVCRQCLERIVSTQARGGGGIGSGDSSTGSGTSSNGGSTFRCPICRETITLPRGGVSALPPSFLVNQLLDLMSRQRREVVPKCSNHPAQELLFCETCDCVFCTVCTGDQHGGGNGNRNVGGGGGVTTTSTSAEHTVIPFSIAIKRMSEILLYKAHQCIGKLTRAHENVAGEMHRLEENVERTYELVNQSFQELINLFERRRQEMLGLAKRTRDDKKRVLREQLALIDVEKAKVQDECEGLEYQVEVRSITKKISDLNAKLDQVSTLMEPRENCFIRYTYEHNDVIASVESSLARFGRILVSKTFPALCTLRLDNGGGEAIVHLETAVRVTTLDYHGDPRKSGGDPVSASVVAISDEIDSDAVIPVKVVDVDDGTYRVIFTVHVAGDYRITVTIFDRPVKNSPLEVRIVEHNNPICQFGCRGSGQENLSQPVGVAVDRRRRKDGASEGDVYVVDTSNGRIKVLAGSDLRYVGHLEPNTGLEERSGTGIALSPSADTLIVVNWRSKRVTEITTTDGRLVNQFSHAMMAEPIAVAVNSIGDVLVADNGLGAVLAFETSGKLLCRIGKGKVSGSGNGSGYFGLIGAVAIGLHDDVLVADSRIQVFSKEGEFLREILGGEAATKNNKGSSGRYGGVTVDDDGLILATRSEKGKNYVQVFDYDGTLLFCIDSHAAKLKRPSGVAVTDDGHVIVVDLGNDCVKKYRYK